jgi:hypothetical protein
MLAPRSAVADRLLVGISVRCQNRWRRSMKQTVPPAVGRTRARRPCRSPPWPHPCRHQRGSDSPGRRQRHRSMSQALSARYHRWVPSRAGRCQGVSFAARSDFQNRCQRRATTVDGAARVTRMPCSISTEWEWKQQGRAADVHRSLVSDPAGEGSGQVTVALAARSGGRSCFRLRGLLRDRRESC